MLSSSPSPGTYLTDELAAVRKAVAELEAQGVRKIVLLSHVGLSNDILWAPELAGIDVIVGGDSHSLMGPANIANVLKEPEVRHRP